MNSSSHLFLDSLLLDLGADQHLGLLNFSWLNALNETAPLKPYKPKPKSEPWLNMDIRRLRQGSRKAERKWKKDKLYLTSVI